MLQWGRLEAFETDEVSTLDHGDVKFDEDDAFIVESGDLSAVESFCVRRIIVVSFFIVSSRL